MHSEVVGIAGVIDFDTTGMVPAGPFLLSLALMVILSGVMFLVFWKFKLL